MHFFIITVNLLVVLEEEKITATEAWLVISNQVFTIFILKRSPITEEEKICLQETTQLLQVN